MVADLVHLGHWGSDAGSDGNAMATQSGSVDVDNAAGARGGALKRQRRASGAASQLGQGASQQQQEANGEASAAVAATAAALADEGAAGPPRLQLTQYVNESIDEIEERGRQVDEALNAVEGLVLQQLDALKLAWQGQIQGIRTQIKNYTSEARTDLTQLSDQAQEGSVRRELLRRATQFLGTNM
ncbi:hypothetical protein Rsub_03456 [Raphidocelis subcapitata]|uniref:Uncharacterized protein n=1 Tax=Raphidocelis subcapitata TaxID=307507 RepID=A0A2V0NY09_9CHLO|nr:hypothetical protein Rsub_03456 [Raphidocelis subcapitata]|eukprot:GBF90460.1 hypothetical protein Rsub_03456 [Raphidocelis subcapitata]